MKRRRIGLVVLLGVALLVSLAGCEGSLFTRFEHWEYVIAVTEFAPHETLDCLVYTHADARFNAVDFFDTYMVATDGASDFDSTFDDTLGVFLYAPVYSSGSVTWLAHNGADVALAGETLRIYHMWK